MKHTKGPWHLDTFDDGAMAIIPDVGFTICPLNPRIGFERDIPNFQLMAAAPELLDALNNLLNWGRDHISPVHNPEAHTMLIAAHNAINKATGNE